MTNSGARISQPTRAQTNTAKASSPQTENRITAMAQGALHGHVSNVPSTAATPKANVAPIAHAMMQTVMLWKTENRNVLRATSPVAAINLVEDTSSAKEAINPVVDTSSAKAAINVATSLVEDINLAEDINPVVVISLVKASSLRKEATSRKVVTSLAEDINPVEVISLAEVSSPEVDTSSAVAISNAVEAMVPSVKATVPVASSVQAMTPMQNIASRNALNIPRHTSTPKSPSA